MKSVLISIKPNWCELIASGEKTVEVRKTRPKIDTPFKVYIYCTIDGGVKGDRLVKSGITCGKVIGEFVCDNITKGNFYLKDACLTSEEYNAYCPYGAPYAWHISDLVIYDKPRELGEFKCAEYHYGRIHLPPRDIARPPQSWMYVESEDNK